MNSNNNSNKKTKEENINTSNIFDDFDVKKEIKKEIENPTKKDTIYYLSLIGVFFRYINYLLLIIITFYSAYIYIQKSNSEFVKDKDYLNSICGIISGNNDILNSGVLGQNNNCSGLSILEKKVEKQINSKKNEYFDVVKELLRYSYNYENYNSSEKVMFAITKTQNKINYFEILSKFDELKNKFSGISPGRVQCRKTELKDNILNIKCYTYSKGVEEDIPGFEGEISGNKLKGTSISFASSFINFLQKDGTFRIINKQKVFKKELFYSTDGFTLKTPIKLQLKYNKNNDLKNL